MRDATRTRSMRFSLVFIGLLFFANPYFAVVDVLPDSIGCVLILLGLMRASNLNRQMSEVRTSFSKLLACCLVKDITVVAILLLCTDTERPVALLGASFVSAIATFYFAYHAVFDLFDGFYSLAVTKECPALYANCKRESRFAAFMAARRGVALERKERSLTERILRTTLVFLFLRELLGTLPEFAALSTSNYFDTGLVYLYDHIGVIRGLSVFVMLIVSILWLVAISRYFYVLLRERTFLAALAEEEHAFVKSHPGIAILRRFGVSFLLIAIGGFFLCDFYLDMQNVIPDWIGALFLIVGILQLDIEWWKRAVCAAAAAAFGVMAFFSTRYAYYFAVHHTAIEISKTEAAATAYFRMWISSLGEFLLFLLFLSALLLLLRAVIRKWAGYMPERLDLEFEQRRRKAYLEEFDAELLRLLVFGFISGLISFLYDYIQEIPDGRIFRLLEFLWGIDLTFAAIFAVLLTSTLFNVHKEIRYRFCFEEE